MHRAGIRTIQMLILGLLASAGLVMACSRDDSATSPASMPVPPSAKSEADVRDAKGSGSTTDSASARLTRARAKMAWVSEIHTAALVDLNTNRSQFLGNEKNKNERICKAVAKLTAKYAARVYAQIGAHPTQEAASEQVAQAVGRLKQCAGLQPMSLFASVPLRGRMQATYAAALDTLPDVTEAYAIHVDALAPAYTASSGSSSAATYAFRPILSNASSLPDQDYEVVVAAADFGVSSVDYWTAEVTSGNYDCPEEGCPEPEMLFAHRRIVWEAVIYVGGSDLVGCAAGAASSWFSGARKASQLAGQCAIWGIAGSAGAGLSLL